MAVPKLYLIYGSPPCRAVFITAKMLGITLDIKETFLGTETPNCTELFKLNPKGTVPTLDDDGKILTDSHAINCYLIEKYDPYNSLYPKDIYKRACVQEKFHFDTGSVFAVLQTIWVGFMNKEFTTIPDTKLERVYKVYDVLETYLTKNKWVCGEDMTLADISIYTSITGLQVLVAIEEAKYSYILEWMKRIKVLPFLSQDDEAMKGYMTWLNTIL